MIKRVIKTFAARASNILVTFGIAIIISNALGATGKGEQALILLGISLMCIFQQVAGGAALVYLTPRYDGKKLLQVAYLWAFTSSGLGFLVLNAFNLMPAYGLHIVALSLLHSLWSIQAFYLLGREKSDWYNSLNFIYSAITLAYLFIKWQWLGLTLNDYVISLYLSHGITLFISFFGLKDLGTGTKATKWEILKKYIHHGGFIQLANVAQLVKSRIHFYYIGLFLGISMVGIYSNALAIAEGIWIITRSISVVQFSKVANLNNKTEARKITTQYTLASVGLSLAGLLVLFLLPDQFFIKMFGKEFTGIHDLLTYLSLAVVSLAASNIISHYFSGIGKNHINFIGSLIGLVITAALGYVFIPKYGLKGAAMASSLAFFATAIFHLVLYQFNKNARTASKPAIPEELL